MAYDPHLTPISVDRQRGAAPRAARPTGGPAGADVSDVPNAIPLSPVNYRLLVVTVIGISAGMWGISALHGYQLDRIANEFRVLGDQAREAGDTEAAIGHLQRTLAIVPEDIAAIEGLAFSIAETAKTMAETAKTTAETAKATAATYRATQLFERILRNSPNATGVRRKLVELYVDLSRHASTFSSDAVEHLDQLLKKDPGNPQLRVLRGESLENLGRFAEARADYEIAIESAPRDFETYDRLVRLLSSRLDKPNEALSRLNELVQRNLKNPAAYLARSRFHWEQGRVRESRIDAVRAYRLDSEDPDVLIFLVTLMSYADWPSSPVTAEQLRDRLSRHAPDGDSRRTTELALVDLAILTGHYEEAQQRLEAILKAEPDLQTARWLHADILNLMGQTEASEKLIGESQSDRGTGSSLAQFLRARNAFSRRNWPLAATLSRQVFDDRYTGPFVRTIAGLNLAACYREMGQSNRERQACLDVLSINPGSSEAVFELASSNLRLGNLAEALPQFRAIENRPEAAAAVAHILIEQNRVRPESEQRWDEAEVAIESAAQTLPNPADAVLLRSRYLFARRKPEEAVSVLKRALKTNAGDVRLWLQLFEADAFRQDWDAALATLDQADAVLQRPQATLAARIALAAARQDRETLAKLTQTVQSLGSADEEVADRANLYRQLAIAWQGLRDVEQAQACWEIVKQERPYDVTVREALLVLALLKADEAGARRLVEEIKDIEGADGVRWRMADAERLFILVERGERKYLREVDQILRQLDEQMPASAVLSTRRGDVARLQGDVEAALQHYQSAVDLGSPSQDCVFQMANLLYQRGQFADVSRLIRQFEQSARRTLAPPLAQLGAIASLQENALLEAVRFAQIGADPDSARFEDQIALGRFQQIAGQFEQAEASFRRAIELAPGQPEAWVSLVSFLMATDRRPEADAVMTQAQSAVSPGLIHITLAQCFDVLDDVEQAAVHYGRVASEFSGDPLQLGAAIRFFMRSGRKDAAIDVLRPIAADVQQASPAAAVVARRLLGAILAESAEYQDRLEALELFNRNLAVPDRIDGREDALLKARLLAASRLRRDQLAARELLEQLRSEGLLPVHDAKQLVELYRISGDSRTAIELTVSLVARTQRNPEILAWATDLLLSLGMSDSHQEFVEQWLELQDSLRPGDLNTQVLRARWFIARGRPDDALSLLQSIPLDQSGDAPSNESANRRLQLAFATDRIAQEFDRNGQLAESEDFARFAEDLYRNAPENPETSLLLVRFLMRRWRVDEAVEICRELRGKLPDERVAGVCVSLLQTRHVGTEQSAEIRGWLGDRHEAQPDSPVLALLCAHAASLDGNYRAAIALHRRVVELQPTNFESLNELALLLTLQAGPSSEAMQLIESAIEQAGPLGVLLDTRATVALANRQPELAERSALDAVAEAPAAEFYFHLAQTQLALDKRDAAKDSLRMAFKRGLHVNSVHPLERPALERLQLELGP